MKPLPPAGSPHRRDTPPSLLSPFSRSAFPAAADGDHDAAVSEQPSVMLLEWWLATVEGDEQKIAVAGTFRWKQILHELYPTPIAKRHSVNILESEDGTVLLISGSLNVSRSLDNGYSNVVCKHFFVGFPHWWQSCNLRYPKWTNSDTGCQPCSSNTSKHPEGFKSSSRNESVFRKSSHLSNGTPRFEEHTCDGDIATSENAAASSEAGKDRKKTPVACLKNQGSWGENQHVASNKKPVGRPKKQISPHEKCRSATKSPGTKSPDSFGENQHVASNKKPVGRPKKQISPHEKCRSATKSPGTKSPDSFGENQHVASNKKPVGRPKKQISPHEKCRSATKSPGTKSPDSFGENQHVASNKKPVGRPKKQISPQEKCRSATKSPGTKSPDSFVLWSPLTRGKAKSLSMSTPEDLKLKRTRSGRVIVPKLVEGCQSIVYGRDGLITAVIGLDSPAVPKWSESRTDGSKKRRTE